MSRALTLGATPLEGGRARFRVWAPALDSLSVELVASKTRVPLEKRVDGVFEGEVDGAPVGSDYFYVLGDRKRPDPASRHQPEGVHGPSRIVDPNAFVWSDSDFVGPPRERLVLYELHVGTFTPKGTFDAVIERLPYLESVGINAIELMPVAEFPGTRNWGYDGVHLFAPESSYGGPEALRRLVNASHRAGIAVFLDVVYNHLGPEGNYLGEFGPYFTDRYRTPWGDALNFDGPGSDPVRRHFVDNAKYWVEEFHVDGLRLDAVHAIYDFGADHVLAQLSREVHAHAKSLGRKVTIVAESDLNDVRVTALPERGGWGLDAQWSDDFHHALFALTSDDRRGYFQDFGSAAALAKAYSDGFVIDGCPSTFRERRHGMSSQGRPGAEHVVFGQNHDQIANACLGERHATLLGGPREKLALVALAAAPCPLLLFQGQEYGETRPFFYFTSHGDADLVRAVQSGRLAEVSAFGAAERYHDPQAPETFAACVLDPETPGLAPHAGVLRLTQALLALRRKVPALGNARRDLLTVRHDDGAKTLGILRRDVTATPALFALNFSERAAACPLPERAQALSLELYSRDARFGHDAAVPPLGVVEPGAESVTLPPLSAAIWL